MSVTSIILPSLAGLDRRGVRGNDYAIYDYLELPTYEIDHDIMVIHDVVWGECSIKARSKDEERIHREQLKQQGVELAADKSDDYDKLLLELVRNPLFIRLQGVEQLTFSDRFSTTPSTSRFSRWQHIWGSLVFARKMTENDVRFSERDKIIFQLRTLFSDVGQTAFSHLGDWIFQGLQGGEDLHDKDLKALLRAFNIGPLLSRYGLSIDEVVFPDVEDWVQCPSPDLCVDRLDYGLREILRWACPPLPLDLYKNALKNPTLLFEIDKHKRLIIKDQKFARYFAAGYSLLPADDWSHPTHRVQMELIQTSVKGALLEKSSQSSAHVRELIYLVDADFDDYFAMWAGAPLGNLMQSIAYEQRRIFSIARKRDLETVFAGIRDNDWQFPEFPHPLKSYSWATKEFGEYPLPSQISIARVEGVAQSMRASDTGLVIGLPRLKPRKVDPLVKTARGARRLSKIEPSYVAYLDGLEDFMSTNYEATVHMRRDFAQKIVDQREDIDKKWLKAMNRSRSSKRLRQAIGSTMLRFFDPARHSFDTYIFSDRHTKYMEQLAAKAVRAASGLLW